MARPRQIAFLARRKNDGMIGSAEIEMMDTIASAMLWVLSLMMVVLIIIALQGYWTYLAHVRMDAARKEMDDLWSKLDAMSKQVRAMKEESPFPWFKRSNP